MDPSELSVGQRFWYEPWSVSSMNLQDVLEHLSQDKPIMIDALGCQAPIDGPGEAWKCCVHTWSGLLIPACFRRTNADL